MPPAAPFFGTIRYGQPVKAWRAAASTASPYTMDIEQAAQAVKVFKPKIVYPYHYRSSDLEKFKQLVGTEAGIEVRVRNGTRRSRERGAWVQACPGARKSLNLPTHVANDNGHSGTK